MGQDVKPCCEECGKELTPSECTDMKFGGGANMTSEEVVVSYKCSACNILGRFVYPFDGGINE